MKPRDYILTEDRFNKNPFLFCRTIDLFVFSHFRQKQFCKFISSTNFWVEKPTEII